MNIFVNDLTTKIHRLFAEANVELETIPLKLLKRLEKFLLEIAIPLSFCNHVIDEHLFNNGLELPGAVPS